MRECGSEGVWVCGCVVVWWCGGVVVGESGFDYWVV